MLSLSSFFESYPENPNTVIIKNTFYPRGLTELDIYNYYINNKKLLLQSTKDRELMFFFSPDLNKTIVKRKNSDGSFIYLTRSNFETIITGRTLSIHNTMRQKEKFGIIDIDYNNFRECKNIAAEVYDFIDKQKIFKNIELRYTGKSSFHIIVYFNKLLDINNIRFKLKEILVTQFNNKYDIAKGKRGSKPHLDLGSNVYRGGFIAPYSLSVWGLKCMVINRSQLRSFNQNQAKIK
jgi:hypothetical protein